MERKEQVEKFLDDVVKTVKTGFDKVVSKTDQLTHMGRLKMDIMSIKRDMEKKYAELGERVYQIVGKGKNSSVSNDIQVQSHIDKIEELEERLALKKDEYEHVARTQQKAEAEAAGREDVAVQETAAMEEAAAGIDDDAKKEEATK